MAKKIIIEKSEGIAEVIDHVLEEPGDDVLISVPKGSVLGKSARNFTLLAREAESAGKSVSIESTDETVMAFAKAAGISGPAKHAAAQVRSGGEVSDIVSPHRKIESEEPAPAASIPSGNRRPGVEIKRKLAVQSEDIEAEDGEDVIAEDDGSVNGESEKPNNFFVGHESRFFKNRTLEESEEQDDSDGSSGGFPWKWVGILALLIIIVGAGAWAVAVVFGHVTVAINFTQTPWQYEGTFTADKSASTINATANIIPAQVFSINKNTTQLFPASSEQDVSVKATGMLTIYNAYSSAPQALVATTRFVTPAGLIFRLVSGVVVPGAEITNGQIVPSSINAEVVADAPGSTYNIGPVAKLTVPGFANTPKFAGFYGSLASSTSGGFTGQKAVPTAADITAAKTKMTSLLQSDLEDSLTGTYPNNFVILDGASSIQMTKLTVNTSTDQNGNFSVFGQATLSAIGFDQAAFKSYLLTLAQTTEASSRFSSLTLQYTGVTPNFVNGTVNFSVNAQGSLEPAFSSSTFDGIIGGKSITSARTTIATLPQLQNGSIAVWPAWLWSIPSNPDKINISVN